MSAGAAAGRRLAAAFEADDNGRIAGLYAEAAGAHEAEGDIDAACFFWTQALVHALAAGDRPLEQSLRLRLAQRNRL